MSNSQAPSAEPVISRFLYDYKKKLSALKIKSFYAFHLCQKKCLEKDLDAHPDECIKFCDLWLKDFYDFKRDSAPADAQQVLIQVQKKIGQLEKNEDVQFQKKYSQAKYQVNYYLNTLDAKLDQKIKTEKAPSTKK